MNILLVGVQGSGKGTQARKIENQYGFLLFETGQTLRDIAKGDNDFSKRIHQRINVEGKLADDVDVAKVIADYAEENKGENIIFDGAIRNLAQNKIIASLLGEFVVFYFVLDFDVAIKRLTGRKVDSITGESFPSNFPKDVNPKTGNPLIVRPDDGELTTIQTRMDIFKNDTLPLIDIWKAEGRKIFEFDASKTENEIFADVEEVLKNIL
ncbi:MAG: nucleoside monophosphate kinase [Candidatus Gracilibacteria bacterium]|nr:nucleoside monophosphate kinase [Candidatus Gracilibacteria bacterium]MDD4530696.1 nucleoside monophosphate kinase [Candidatus Gracilibacteria bacterium]